MEDIGSLSLITALAWRPDGKMLALGHEDGSIPVYDIEKRTEVKLPQGAKPHSQRVTCLNWVECEVKVNRFGPSHEFLPPKPPAFPGSQSGSKSSPGGVKVATAGDESSSFNILASGDATGVVTLSAYGYFPIGCIDLSGAFNNRGVNEANLVFGEPTVCNICLTSDLCTLTVTLRARLLSHHNISTHDSAGTHDIFRYHVTTVDTSLLWRRRSELSTIALHYGAIGELMRHAKKTLAFMEKRWSDGQDTLSSKIGSLLNALRSHGRVPSPQSELFMLFLSGIPSDAVEQFISNSFPPQSIQRMRKALNTACKDIDVLYTEHWLSAAEGLLYRVAELHGLARWRQHFRHVGLHSVSIENLVLMSNALIVKGEKFIKDVRSARSNFVNFFSWLQSTFTEIDGSSSGAGGGPSSLRVLDALSRSTSFFYESLRISQLLNSHFRDRDRSGVSTESAEDILHMHINDHFTANQKHQFGVKRDELNKRIYDLVRGSLGQGEDFLSGNESLAQCFTLLRKKLHASFRQPSEQVSSSFVPLSNTAVFRFTPVAVEEKSNLQGVIGKSALRPDCVIALRSQATGLATNRSTG